MRNKRNTSIIIWGTIIELIFYLGIPNDTIRMVGLGISLVPLFIFDKREIGLLLTFLIPNQRLLVLQDGGTSILNIYLISILIIISYRYVKLNITFTIGLISILSYSMILGVINQGFIEIILMVKLYIVSLVYFDLIVRNEREYTISMAKMVIYGIIITILISFLDNGIVFSNRFSGGDLNEPNYFGSICAFGLSILFVLNRSQTINNKILIFSSLLFIFFGLTTLSRSFLLCLIILLIIYVLIEFKSNYKKSILILAPILIIGIRFIINNFYKLLIINDISNRLLNPTNNDISGGRIKIWETYIDLLFASPFNLLMGIGANAFKKYNVGQVAHNFLIEDLVSIGLIGVLITYMFLFCSFKRIINKQRKYLVSLVPLMILLISNATLHSFLGLGGLVQLFISFAIVKFYTEGNI